MQEPYIGELALYPYNFAPKYWLPCNGQLLPIQQYSALFSLLGTTYGGNGTTNFALPNLQSASPVGFGQAPGLSNIEIGETGGMVNVTLNIAQMPSHGHALAGTGTPSAATPVGGVFATASNADGDEVFAYGVPDGTTMSPGVVLPSGSNMPFNNRPPYLGLEWCIAIEGVYPSRQ
jgi:microcystin-dependent protein